MVREVGDTIRKYLSIPLAAVIIALLTGSAIQYDTWPELREQHTNYLVDNGWTYTFVDTIPDHAEAVGLTSYNSRTIYLADGYTNWTVCHEVGHVLCHYTNADSIVQQLYNLEKEGAYREYSKMSWREFIADAYAEYCIYPERLKQDCPLTYAFVHRVYFQSPYAIDVSFVSDLKSQPLLTLAKDFFGQYERR